MDSKTSFALADIQVSTDFRNDRPSIADAD
ncbi:predicted protein [Sclerotinia sclerotiorum 1980 UF-70]|uniref:Uncharacterized protein n=1 Tax=Sclerotinia sclerotiorum (strain ATCC 18683 / 1980 / Ss-1) TaxID=665079 RepID=A7ESN3_SCLS1|nr:predicted protein [Sclerotinia sclerotiorum 1980 UF-70]EDN92475.1 predicted protein [Sclerotinia sclerotiorum 1980 UF-70]